MIFYGINGEGLGHATRAWSIISKLDCPVHIFTYGLAFDFLNNKTDNRISCSYIHGLKFQYNKPTTSKGMPLQSNCKINILDTISHSLEFKSNYLDQNIKHIGWLVEKYKPKLFITDFEPSIARAAKIYNVPLLSIDNQHKFLYSRLKGLPLKYKLYNIICGLVTKLMVPNPDKVIISTFHYDDIEGTNGASVVNGFLRPEFNHEISETKKVVIYLKNASYELLGMIPSKYDIALFGTSLLFRTKTVFPLSLESFAKELSSCSHVISNAGNQILTECRYLGKPCLAIPVEGQYEQYINGYYVNKLNLGMSVNYKDLNQEKINFFFNNYQCYKPTVHDSINEVKMVINSYL